MSAAGTAGYMRSGQAVVCAGPSRQVFGYSRRLPWEEMAQYSSAAGITIFMPSTHHLYAVNSDGTLKWRFQTGDVVTSSPAIDKDGTIYMGSWDHHLYAVNSDGTLKWRYETEGKISSSPAIGQDGTIYAGSDDHYLYAIDAKGGLKWRFRTDDGVSSSPAIDMDGTIYVGSKDHGLYAIRSESAGYQVQSPWPGFHFKSGKGNFPP
jgi:outer membrane protein assembly factor BamB